MSREWKPGEVVVLEGRDGSTVRAIWQGNQFATQNGHYLNHWQVTARPLVVIDPESLVRDNEADRGGKAWELVNCLRRIAEADGQTWRARLVSRIADEAEKQLRAPEPAEPTGLGAVVEVHGRRWVYTGDRGQGGQWWYSAAEPSRWSEFDSVTVLSEGVTL